MMLTRNTVHQDEERDKTVLSIQSHVVHGYVGNKAATFPLQLRGWDVDALNVVQFSNNTGYGSFRGDKLTGEQVENLYTGLINQNLSYDALLTGYLPNASVVEAVGRMGADMKKRNPNSLWVLDPVMGDDGTLYVNEDVIPAYTSILKTKGLVTILTPNYFEVELLTGIKLKTKEDVHRAFHKIHYEFGIPHIVITSLPHPAKKGVLLTVGSSGETSATGSAGESDYEQPFMIEQELFDSYFTGTGDLFASLLLDNFTRYGSNHLRDAALATIKTLRQVLRKTWKYANEHHCSPSKIADKSMKYHELRLIQSTDVITNLEDSENKESLKCVPF